MSLQLTLAIPGSPLRAQPALIQKYENSDCMGNKFT